MLLRRFRLAAGRTQTTLAERSGLSERAINDLERDPKRLPRLESVRLLADALGLSPQDRAALLAAARPQAAGALSHSATVSPGGTPHPARHNLPVQLTPLLGREREVAAVTALLRHDTARLVTLTGPGGVGKTRLGLEVAAELVDACGDGVWFVRLSRLADPALVLPTIAHNLGLQEAGRQPVEAVLREWLRTRAVLLLLDNFEQVAAAAREVAELLASSPGLKVLVTSRVRLHLRGEQEVPVPPLSLPSVAGSPRLPPVERLSQYAAVALFLARAREARPDFQLTGATAPAVLGICVRLDGLPLALELAATRLKVLPPPALLRRLEQTLPLLDGGARDLEARQQTMRATLAWSEDLLQPAEQRLFGRLAVFVGGFTLEAAEAVCAAPAGAEPLGVDVLAGLGVLVDQSLVQSQTGDDTEEGGDEARFRLLSVVREYALERLEASGEADALRRAHAIYYQRQIEERALAVYGPAGAAWMGRFEREHDNFRAALSWAREQSDAELGLRLAASLGPFWYVTGLFTEGRGWVEGLLALSARAAGDGNEKGDDGGAGASGASGVSTVARAKALAWLSNFAGVQEDIERALVAAEEAAALVGGRQAGWAAGVALQMLGQVAWARGDLQRATTYVEESVAQLQAVGEPWLAAAYLTGVGFIALDRGDLERATACCEESLAFARRAGADYPEGLALRVLADVARQRGDLAGAEGLGREQLLVWQRLGAPTHLARNLEGLGLTAAVAGEGARAARAARLLGAAAALRERVGAPLRAGRRASMEREIAVARATLGEVAWAAAFAAGRTLTLEEAITEALGDGESAGA
jgi:non-specific serine/threonine protein kinase